jgi:hypothetical protein
MAGRFVFQGAEAVSDQDKSAAEDPYARYARLNPTGHVTPAQPKPATSNTGWRNFVDENGIHVPRGGAMTPLKRGADWMPRKGWSNGT